VKPIWGGLLPAIIGFALALSPASSWAAYPGENGLIAYSDLGHGREIYTVSPEGGERTRLTHNAVEERRPSWSADGRRIAFQRWNPEKQDWKVWTMRADGTHQRLVTDFPGSYGGPYFSPGGGRLLMSYSSHRGSINHLIRIRTDGTGRARLPGGSGAEYSPDGKQIMFIGAPSSQSTKDGIWIMRRDGSDLRRLVNPARGPGNSSDGDVSVENADFSPDGSHIVYDRCAPQGPPHGCSYDIVVMRRSGRFKRVVSDYSHDSQPVFSPDGARIALIRTSLCGSDPYDNEIFTIARDGTDPQRVTDVPYCYGGQALDPSWQPSRPVASGQ
jgi:Tol biopolymer transport system component